VDSTPSPPDQPPPWSPRPCQFGALPFQLCLKPRPVSVHLVEHGGDIPRYADLISPIIPSLECLNADHAGRISSSMRLAKATRSGVAR
jgi:hypothetical protein